MNVSGILPQPLLDIAQAIGFVDFEQRYQRDVAAAACRVYPDRQRPACRAVRSARPGVAAPAGAPSGAKWHQLLGSQTAGNLFLTIEDFATPTIVGLGGQYAGGAASLLFEIPVLALNGANLSEIAGTAGGPVRLTLDVQLGWTRPTHPISLSSISLALVFAPLASPPVGNVVITLRGLDLDGSGARDVKVDPAALGAEAATLLVGLIREKLNEISTTATGDALAVATHFIPLLGLDGSLPAFPFATLGTDPQAVINWLHALAVGNPPPLAKCLVHLAGLLGVTAPNVTNSTAGTWSVALFAPNSTSSISIELVLGVAGDAVTQTLGLQIGASLVPSAGAAAALNAVATLFTVPLSGAPTASVLPAASIIVCTPPASTPLIAPSSGKFSLDGIQAGIRWNGTAITPLIELDNVVIPGAGTFPTINLSNANTVVASAASGLITTLLADLGASSGAGAHLAALAGLTEPATDTSAPLVDVTQLVTNPIAAITALHRNALVSAAQHPPALHPWLIYLSELEHCCRCRRPSPAVAHPAIRGSYQ